ncbi:MAG: hypothetical protein B7X90_14160 [Novosphingobium sp. 17-62-19]|uniref:hypothetical protein n=1 Tax=Novosphingobium sp. 17-62-19 TaxID=1970406 RepID=UPI000BD10BE9|nr:hypothetical protein [Novosphingobium sp. 17-62-19]OYX90025.1 MAG: hypothetical protein B7Y74_16570 [Novosphingobium sp. 35-62-5]OZA17703.1 MAG: hypothetical protein B7X90_14160 [Novosphingobium sp. 17-62-19]HQS98000.1 hypothetical protein [Novosphingobium sp.]
MKTAFFALVTLASLTGCATIPVSERSDGFAVIGQTTRVAAVKIRPESVIEDSRCPMNARCVWAGQVVVDTTVMRGGTAERRQFTLGQPAGDGLVLDTVEPGKMTGKPLKPSDYSFHFSINQ